MVGDFVSNEGFMLMTWRPTSILWTTAEEHTLFLLAMEAQRQREERQLMNYIVRTGQLKRLRKGRVIR